MLLVEFKAKAETNISKNQYLDKKKTRSSQILYTYANVELWNDDLTLI